MTDPRPVVLVSACLVGEACNHRGGASTNEAVLALARRARLLPVCPEVAGGLATPRPAAEIQADGTVSTLNGDDVTESYRRGAGHAVAVARAVGAVAAVLKARSPSCGCHQVYDGTFTGTRRSGEGITAAALRSQHILVISEEDLEAGVDVR